MAFLRKVKTASGATAVQVAMREAGRDKVLKHLGSAHSDEELLALLEIGRKELNAGQMEIDFDSLDSGLVLDPLVEHVSSALLWRVLQDAYRVLGFDRAIRDRAFEELVLARIVQPTSKADTIRVLENLGVKHSSRRTLFNSLQRCAARDYRARLATACFAHATKLGDLSLVLYDVTTLYFEAEREDEDSGANQGLRKVGYSKERRVDPQITVGLLVDRSGFPFVFCQVNLSHFGS